MMVAILIRSHNVQFHGTLEKYFQYSRGSPFLSELQINCAYVIVLKIKYWLTCIVSLFALTANIAKIK